MMNGTPGSLSPVLRRSLGLALLCSVTGWSAGCLGPQVDDTVVGGDLLLPADTEVASVYDDSGLDASIAAADGVEDFIPLLHGFANGQPVAYWDLGPTPAVAAPLFYLMDPATEQPADHLPIIDAMPGDANYSPYWAMFFVNITEAYNGELITSIAALEEAQRLGLVEAPEESGLFANCPIVAGDVEMEMPDGTSEPATSWGFIRGKRVAWFDMVGLTGSPPPELAEDGVTVPADDLYRLRREGGEPLSEAVRRVDMTGDGDAVDSNDILAANETPMAQRRTVVSVVVPADYESIDTSLDQTVATFTTASDLFDIVNGERVAQAGNVLAYEVVEESRNVVMLPPSAP